MLKNNMKILVVLFAMLSIIISGCQASGKNPDSIDFPIIKVKFVTGVVLLEKYPKGKIPSKDHIQFFN